MRRITPSLVVSIVALVLAAAGTSVAAISFAKNAGAVDGKSAVGASASNAKAAGKLVATGKSGRIPAGHLDLTGVIRGGHNQFHTTIDVVDNTTTPAVTLTSFPGLGTLTASCGDQAAATGKEDPQLTLAFVNGSGQTVNFARSVNAGAPKVGALASATPDTFVINSPTTFREHIELNGIQYVIEGVVRQAGAGTAAGICGVYGYALVIPA